MGENVFSMGKADKHSAYHKHARKLLQNLNKTRMISHLCDAFVEIQDVKILVQKSVLSAASEFLRALFNYNEGLSQVEGKMCIKLAVSIDTFRSILDYIYTAEIILTPDNVQDILQAADLLLLEDLKTMCCDILQECISPYNCIGIQDFTARLSCPWINLKVTQFLDDNFVETTQCEEFFNLSFENMEKLLCRDSLYVRSEEDVLQGLVRWCLSDWDHRSCFLPDLINRCVRVSLLSDRSLYPKLDGSNRDAVDLVMTAVNAKRQLCSVDVPRGCVQCLVVCGGQSLHGSESEPLIKDTVHIVNLDARKDGVVTGRWFTAAPMLTCRTGHGLVETGGLLFAVGGRGQHGSILSSGEMYDPIVNEWTFITSMMQARVGFGLVAVDDCIYAIGGSNDLTDPLITMEVYNIFTKRWRSLPDMILRRLWSTFTVVGRQIFVIGGGVIGKFYESVEYFDTRTEAWSSVSPLRERRCDAHAVTVGNDIFVFGGFRRLECPGAMQSGHSMKLCGTERYSCGADRWVQAPHTHHRGSSVTGHSVGLGTELSHLFGAMFDGRDVLIVGSLHTGDDDRYECVRAFDPVKASWRCLVPRSPPDQAQYRCCLLRLPAADARGLQQKLRQVRVLP